MNAAELAAVVAKIQLGDNRDVDELVLDEWEDTIGHLPFDDAIAAVRMHRQESTAYLTPAHVVANVRRIIAARAREDRILEQRQRLGLPRAPITFDRDEHDRQFRDALRAARIARGQDPDVDPEHIAFRARARRPQPPKEEPDAHDGTA